jgi:hypothetical protein
MSCFTEQCERNPRQLSLAPLRAVADHSNPMDRGSNPMTRRELSVLVPGLATGAVATVFAHGDNAALLRSGMGPKPGGSR